MRMNALAACPGPLPADLSSKGIMLLCPHNGAEGAPWTILRPDANADAPRTSFADFLRHYLEKKKRNSDSCPIVMPKEASSSFQVVR